MIDAAVSNGYVAELLRALGVPAATAAHVQDLALRPLTVVLVLIATIVASHLGARVIRRSLERIGQRFSASREQGESLRLLTVGRIVATAWRATISVIGVIVVLSVIGINLAPFLAGATVIGATIGFGAQSLVRDFLSGFLMLVEDQHRIGDVISVNDVTGTVEEVSLRVTQLRDDDGTAWYIPNGQILRLGNHSRSWSRARIEVIVKPLGSVDDATNAISEAIASAMDDEEVRDKCLSPPRILGVTDVTVRGIAIAVEARTVTGGNFAVEVALRQAIAERLARDGLMAEPPPGPWVPDEETRS